MDQTELQQKIVLYYSKLPPKAQEAFGSMAWMETLKKISAKYQLSGAEMETLGTETTLLLLGIIHEDEYQEILRKDLSLPEISTNRMIREINESVIDPIRPELTTAFETNKQFTLEENPDIEGQLDERFGKLAPEVQNAILASNFQAKLYMIAQEHKLTTAQLGELETATTQVILDIIPPHKFEGVLKASLDLPE